MELKSELDFIDNIWKTIYRWPISCKCPECGRWTLNWIQVYNEQHADYLKLSSDELWYIYFTNKDLT